jgi:glycine dehydrogenase subunit 1
VQTPNFFGCLEEVSLLAERDHRVGALLVVVVDPISLGILKSPGEYEADIVVGEGQGLGNVLNFGGPYLGFFATRREYIRQMPGRIVGATVDTQGRRGYCLTLQTREQHIRRERSTSNICTNEALNALAATIYMALLGRAGLKEVAYQSLQKAHYTHKRICDLGGFAPAFSSPFFKEFVIRSPIPLKGLTRRLEKAGILGGIDLEGMDRRLKRHLLICVTEKRTKEEIDRLVDCLGYSL